MTKQNGSGYLRVWVTTGGQSFPVVGADVEIWEPGGGMLYRLRTSSGGLTQTVEVPAPAANESLTPDGGVRPYAVYTIRVSADGYTPVRDRSVSVFDGITAVQPVILQPASGGARNGEREVTPIQLHAPIAEPDTENGTEEEIYARPYPQWNGKGDDGMPYGNPARSEDGTWEEES